MFLLVIHKIVNVKKSFHFLIHNVSMKFWSFLYLSKEIIELVFNLIETSDIKLMMSLHVNNNYLTIHGGDLFIIGDLSNFSKFTGLAFDLYIYFNSRFKKTNFFLYHFFTFGSIGKKIQFSVIFRKQSYQMDLFSANNFPSTWWFFSNTKFQKYPPVS